MDTGKGKLLQFNGPSTGGANRFVVVMIVALMMTAGIPLMPVEAAEASINLREPDGGEDLIAGSVFTIRWQVSSSGGYIAIYLSTNGGERWSVLDTILSQPDHSFGYYDWNIPPNLESDACKIRVIWKSSTGKPWTEYARDESTGNFAVAPGVTVQFTEMPTLVAFGRYYLTTFDLYDPYDMVDHLDFKWRVYEGGWGSWEDLPGHFIDYDKTRGWIWWSPDYYETAFAEMRVEAVARGSSTVLASDTSDQFDIVSSATFLIQPNGGVTLVAGSTYTIEWRTSADPEQVLMGVWLRYSLDGGGYWYTVAYTENDFEHDWTVPSTTTDNLLIQVISQYGEWYTYATDMSDGPNRIIANANVPSVTLEYPNPPVDGGVVMGSGEVHHIDYSLTGASNILSLAISYSTNDGSTYTPLTTLTSTSIGRSYAWTVPAVDSYEARVKIVMSQRGGGTQTVTSNNAFYIFDTIEFNRPPVAMAGEDLEGGEGDTITLDGSTSYDPDGDPLTYSWTQVSPSFITAVLAPLGHSRPSFTIDALQHFPVTFVFELEVSDGIEHTDLLLYNVDRVTVVIEPRPPELTNFWPDTGWTGTPLVLEGTDLMGAEILLGSTVLHSVPTSPVSGSPDPDIQYTLTIPDTIAPGTYEVSVRTMIGTSSLGATIEIFPVPQWLYDNSIGFGNNATHTLSYPWNPWGEGRMKDAFGNDCYLSLWVCIGLPYWTPWDGWGCLGYLVDEPFCPDPLAAIFYGALFCWIARNGECFGMSCTALQYYHGDISVGQFGQDGVTEWSDLERSGEFQERIQWRQGSQLSSEVLNGYLYSLVDGLIPSTPLSGMGKLLAQIEASVGSGELGVVTIICGEGAHAMVPYAVEDVDPTTTRIYVYDSNRPQFSSIDEAIFACREYTDPNDSPPYIEIRKSGVYWEWRFEWADGTMWDSRVGIAFVPYGVINGDRTMPLSIDGIITLLAGSCDVAIEDDGGNTMGYDADGEMLWDIDGAAPLPSFSGAGDRAKSYFLPYGDYVNHITGNEDDGKYNWSTIFNGTSGFSIEEAGSTSGTEDTVSVKYTDDNPYRGWMTYGTSDSEKEYTVSTINNFGERTRVYRIIGADLTDDGEHGFGTNEDYSGLVFHNGGDTPTTFDVEFQGNVLAESVWNGSSPPVAPDLPTASRKDITVGPGETVEIYPITWLDLNNAIVLLATEGTPSAPLNLTATEEAGVVTLTWDPPEDDGDLPITEYNILRGDTIENLTAFTVVGTGTTFTDSSVERNTTYFYAVTARNMAGNGPLSEIVSVDIPALTIPTNPRALNVAEDNGIVTLTWGTPVSDGGSPITSYIVMRGLDPGNVTRLTDVGLDLEFVDTDVKAGKTYHYQVRAVNAIGAGLPSTPVSVEVPKKGDPGDDGSPWLLYAAIIIAVVVLIAIGLMKGGKRGGPEASAPMDKEPVPEPTPPPMLAKEAGR